MGLAQVIYPPPTPQGVQEWMFNHYQQHLAIIQGVLSSRGVQLQLYNIYPFDPKNTQQWLANHQQAHNDFESLLGIQGNDLTSVDFTNKKAADSWFYLNFQSHQSAASILAQGI